MNRHSAKPKKVKDFLGKWKRQKMQDERILPQALDMEKSLLGSIILDSQLACEAFSVVVEDDFYFTANKIIFRTIKEMQNKNIPMDDISIVNYLRDKGELASVGYEPYIAELINNVATSTSIKYYVEALKHKAMARKVISAAAEIQSLAYKAESIDELAGGAEEILFKQTQSIEKNEMKSLGEIIPIEMTYCLEKKYAEITGYGTGFEKVDKITCGFRRKDLIIIGGRPSNGKTAFALSCALKMALRGIRILYFTLESNKEALARRVLSSASQVNLIKMSNGYMKHEEKERFQSACIGNLELPIIIDDSYDLSTSDIRSKGRYAISKYGIELIVIDYLQLIKKDHYGKNMSTNDKTGMITRDLKMIAKDLNVPMVVLSQLHRIDKKTKAKNHAPRLDDLRDSGSIEQDADMVLLVHREELYDKDDEALKNKADVDIAKNKDGPIGIVDFIFNKEFAQYIEDDETHGF
jgi:replicative DNA helicase